MAWTEEELNENPTGIVHYWRGWIFNRGMRWKRDECRSQCRCWWEWPTEKTLNLIRSVEGKEHLDAIFEKGKGAIVLAPHHGKMHLIKKKVCREVDDRTATCEATLGKKKS